MTLGSRIGRLERAIGAVAARPCPACGGGGTYPFVVRRWVADNGTSSEESEPSDVYDAGGRCRACGDPSANVIVLALPEGVRDLVTGAGNGSPDGDAR